MTLQGRASGSASQYTNVPEGEVLSSVLTETRGLTSWKLRWALNSLTSTCAIVLCTPVQGMRRPSSIHPYCCILMGISAVSVCIALQ